jgi:hypothetical protein
MKIIAFDEHYPLPAIADAEPQAAVAELERTVGDQGFVGANTTQGDGHAVHGATEPSWETTDDVASAQRQLRYLQWALPALTGTVVVLGAQQGEQQRPREILTGLGSKLAGRARARAPSLSAA